MPRSSGPKVSVESVEEMIELVRQNTSLYDPASPDHMDSVVSANIWKSIAEKLLPSNPDMTGKPSVHSIIKLSVLTFRPMRKIL